MEVGGREVAFARRGLVCRVDRPVAVFTEVKVTITLPSPGREEISCRGAVVECNYHGEKDYRIHLYFTDIDEESGSRLAPYCSTR